VQIKPAVPRKPPAMFPNSKDEGQDQPQSDSGHPKGTQEKVGEDKDAYFGNPLHKKRAKILHIGFQNVGGVSSARSN
jgi:hypothetical protein